MIRKRTVDEIQVGDRANDADCRFAAGAVVAVGPGWFEVRWCRGGVTYVKRHGREDFGKLVVW